MQEVINQFVVKIGRSDLGAKKGGVDMTEWYEMLAFDVLGEMAFGQGFMCVENGVIPFLPLYLLFPLPILGRQNRDGWGLCSSFKKNEEADSLLDLRRGAAFLDRDDLETFVGNYAGRKSAKMAAAGHDWKIRFAKGDGQR